MIKILIVDDSRIFRSFIKKAFESIDNVEIIGTAFDGVKAMEFLNNPLNETPDIITLDIEMPQMDGFETLQAINDFKKKNNLKICVIMVSSLTQAGAEATIKSLRNGAFDFISKPKSDDPNENLEKITKDLSRKLLAYQIAQGEYSLDLTKKNPHFVRQQSTISSKYKAILIGVSTGGPEALDKLIPLLTEVTELPIFIVQHMPKGFIESLANRLNKISDGNVMKAENGQSVKNKEVYISPGNEHLVIKKVHEGIQISLNSQPAENGCRPSIDIMFRSALDSFDGKVIALTLTGMGNDGAKGAAALKRKGAHIIAQDQLSSVVWGIPKKTIETGCVDKVLSLMEIPKYIEKILKN